MTTTSLTTSRRVFIIILNFSNTGKSLHTTLFAGLLSHKFMSQNNLYTNNVDLASRVQQGEFYINSVNYLWTSFWYLPSYVLSTIVLFVLMRTRVFVVSQLLLVMLVFFYLLSLFDYNLYNPSSFSEYCRGEHVNTLLTNSVNKFHPFIFYNTIAGVLLCLAHLPPTISRSKFRLASALGSIYSVTTVKLPLVIWTLFLGSWWAAQEGSWGGWWNWDPSEVFGLVVMLFFIQTTHKTLNSYSIGSYKLVSALYVIIILVLYLFIQLNFDLISHNFGTKVSQFIDSYQFLVILSITSFLGAVRVSHLLSQQYPLRTALVPQVPLAPKLCFLSLVAFTPVFLSFTDLLNNFTWSLVGTNLLNSLNFTAYYSSVLVLLILLSVTKPNLFTTLSGITVSGWGWVFPGLMPTTLKKSLLSVNHITLFVFLLVIYSSINQVVTLWGSTFVNNSSFVASTLCDAPLTYISLSSLFVDSGYATICNNTIVGSGWNIFKVDSTPLVHNFTYMLTSGGASQSLVASLLDFHHSITILDATLTQLNYLLILFILLITLWFRGKLLIIF